MYKITIVILVFLFTSCTFEKKNKSTSFSQTKKNDVHIVDLDNAQEEPIFYSSLFKKVTPIILETNTDALIGNIDALQAFGQYIFVLDKDKAKSLFVFDKNGQFIRKIGGRGKGPDEYDDISDFTINTEKEEIYLLDSSGPRVYKYKIDGTYISSVTLEVNNANVRFIQYHQEKLYTDMCYFTQTEDDYLLQSFNLQNGKQEERFLQTSLYNKGWNELYGNADQDFFISKTNLHPKYMQMFMDTVISIHHDGISPFLAIKSKDLVTEKDLTSFKNQHRDVSDLSEVLRSSQKIFWINNFIEGNTFVLFKYIQGNTVKTVLYNMQYKQTYIAKGFRNDMIFTDLKNFMSRFVFSDMNGVYVYFNSYFTSDFIEHIKKGQFVNGLENVDKLVKLNEESNPVIFYYEYQ